MFVDDNYAPDQYIQIHVSIIGNYFGVILKVTGQDKWNVSNNQQQPPTVFHYLNITSSLCPSTTIKLYITTLKPMCLSSKPPL